MRWTVVIPAKALPEAKSRLAPASSDAAAHRRLVEAIRRDTIAAAQAADVVARVLIVVDRPDTPAATATPDGLLGSDDWLGSDGLLGSVVQSSPGLNAALAEAAAHARDRWPGDGIAALVGDLPALRADELVAALLVAQSHPTSYVPDAAGTGTTLLTAVPGSALRPAFGRGSAARHGEHAAAIAAGAGLRHDVDTAEDLRAAVELGVGPATAAALAQSVPWRSS